MSGDDPRTFGRARLSFADEREIDDFVEVLGRFERGELDASEWRAYRLVRGTYGQRQPDDAQMLRVKVPQGLLTVSQLDALADVADRYSRGFGHITTRQNVQFHFVRLHDIEPAMRRLADAGLTTREACGNSVRNVTACPYAGVAAGEIFDVTPYAEALTRHLLRHPLSSRLPRKFKIGFEGCSDDHIRTTINDLGFRAQRSASGARGFRVTVAGGTSILCSTGHLLHEFLPAGDLLAVPDAVLRVFARLGDYQHKQRNRLKFLLRSLGWERWRDEYERARAELQQEEPALLPLDPESPPVEERPAWSPAPGPSTIEIASRVRAATPRGPGLHPMLPVLGDREERWRRTNVRPQKQGGFAIVTALAPLGDLTSAQMRIVADLAAAYGDGTVRVTSEQDLVFRWIRGDRLRTMHRSLSAAGLALAGAGTIVDVGSCPGAESCRLAVTQSRGLGQLLEQHIRRHPALADAAGAADMKISGCPNGCGQHHVTAIGFQGSVRRIGGRVVPQYFVMVGGGIDGDAMRFGRLVAKIPARRCPEAVERLVTLFAAERQAAESLAAFYRRVDPARVKGVLADLEALTPETADPLDYVDLGEEAEFQPAVLDGECSA